MSHKQYEITYVQAGLTANTTVFASSIEEAKNYVSARVPFAKVLTAYAILNEDARPQLLCE